MTPSTFVSESHDGEAAGPGRGVEELQAGVAATKLPPHFLLNSLHVIAVLLRKGEDQQAARALESLASLLGYVVRAGERHAVRLADELRFVRDYLRLERLRFRREPTLEVEAGPLAREAEVPATVLQPLVENSLRHGPEGGEGAVRIRLRARITGRTLVVEVSDDGRGLPPSWDPERDMGTGLEAVKGRLRLAAGTDAGMEFGRSREGGARVVLRLPWSPRGGAGAMRDT